MAGFAVTVVDSGGLAVTAVDSGAPAAQAVDSGGIAITLATSKAVSVTRRDRRLMSINSGSRDRIRRSADSNPSVMLFIDWKTRPCPRDLLGRPARNVKAGRRQMEAFENKTG